MATRAPYNAFNFKVQFQGGGAPSVQGGFTEVSGLESEQDVVEYRSGDQKPDETMKIPGLSKKPNLVLRRGIIGTPDLFTWRKQVIEGLTDANRQAASVTIQLMDEKGASPVMTWTLRRAWPVKWTGPSLAANRSETAVESIEIAYEEIAT
ncbi:phage tail protein [Sorangium sp. So ce429]